MSQQQAAPQSGFPGDGTRPPSYQYHLLRAAIDQGHGGLAGFNGEVPTDLMRRAERSFELESLVLTSREAAELQISDGQLAEAVHEVASRYPDQQALRDDLQANGLDLDDLQVALKRELIFDGVMQRIGARRPDVTEMDERLFFELRKDRFTKPETRVARHILITINPDFADSDRDAAWARIQALSEKLSGRSNRFPSLARRNSECPTAMQDGRLGTIPRGQLYPSLDAVLFEMEDDAVSTPVESEMGFHLLWCEKIHRAKTTPFSSARPRIRQLLEERGARNCQKHWIGELRAKRAAETAED